MMNIFLSLSLSDSKMYCLFLFHDYMQSMYYIGLGLCITCDNAFFFVCVDLDGLLMDALATLGLTSASLLTRAIFRLFL